MLSIEKAIILSAQAHRGQRDLAGEPYILHPLRVMLTVESEPARIVAVLHDAMEHDAANPIDFDELRAAQPSAEIIDALRRLTRAKGACYREYLGEIIGDPLAFAVKIADLIDNSDTDRLTQVELHCGRDKADQLRNKYTTVLKFIGPHIGQPDEDLILHLGLNGPLRLLERARILKL